MAKKLNFDNKSNIWSKNEIQFKKNEILVRNFKTSTKVESKFEKSELFSKNPNFGQKAKFWTII